MTRKLFPFRHCALVGMLCCLLASCTEDEAAAPADDAGIVGRTRMFVYLNADANMDGVRCITLSDNSTVGEVWWTNDQSTLPQLQWSGKAFTVTYSKNLGLQEETLTISGTLALDGKSIAGLTAEINGSGQGIGDRYYYRKVISVHDVTIDNAGTANAAGKTLRGSAAQAVVTEFVYRTWKKDGNGNDVPLSDLRSVDWSENDLELVIQFQPK